MCFLICLTAYFRKNLKQLPLISTIVLCFYPLTNELCLTMNYKLASDRYLPREWDATIPMFVVALNTQNVVLLVLQV